MTPLRLAQEAREGLCDVLIGFFPSVTPWGVWESYAGVAQR